MKTNRERTEEIELWEEMCYREKRLDEEQKGVIADSLCTYWDALKANTDIIIEPERLESLVYCAIIVQGGYDTFDRVAKSYPLNTEDKKAVLYIMGIIQWN